MNGVRGAVQQWTALSGRSIAGGARDGDLVFAVVAPVIFFVCFYVPLRHAMQSRGIDYAQYLLPVIVLQAMLFTAMSAGERSATDSLGGMGTRLRSLPVPGLVPMFARMSANMTRAVLSLVGAVIVGYIAGFRFHGGIVETIGFFALALLFGLAMSFGADAFGAACTSQEAASQVLLIPQLLLTMISTGIVPAEGFPAWIRPVARDQPVSQLADALRGLANGSPTAAAIGSALAWSIGLLLVFAVLALRLERRER